MNSDSNDKLKTHEAERIGKENKENDNRKVT